MKEDFNDIQLKTLLKENSHDPGENPWFTRRLLNRLPQKEQTTIYLDRWIYAIAALLCGVCWIYLMHTDFFQVITVRTLIYTAALIIGSLILTIQAITHLLD